MGIEDIVLDSSVIVADAAKERFQGWAETSIKNAERVHILDLAYYEVVNALNTYYRRDLMNTKAYVETVRKALDFLNTCQLHEYSEALESAIRIGLETNVPIYDSAYISLAQKLRCKLLTVDLALYAKLSAFPDIQKILLVPTNN